MEIKKLSYVITGVVATSFLLAACSSSGGQPPATARVDTPTPTATATRVPTPTAPAANAPAPTSTSSQMPTPTAVPQSPPTASGEEIKMTIRNNTFPEELRVKAGAKVVFVVTNEERREKHSFELPDFDVYSDVEGGETVKIEWEVPDKKGEWDAGCFLTEPGEVHDGMEGVLIIE